METVYDVCPELYSDHFLYRPVMSFDVADLTKMYADRRVLSKCNFDNINVNCFDFADKAQVIELVRFWQNQFRARKFLRYSVINKKSNRLVGSLEFFRRMTEDDYKYCCMMRMDLKPWIEKADLIEEILRENLEPMLLVFDSYKMATKVSANCQERLTALKRLDFDPNPQKLTGLNGEIYDDYYVYTQPIEKRFAWPPEERTPIFNPYDPDFYTAGWLSPEQIRKNRVL